MRYYLIAGEASGDLHGAGLVRALRALDPAAEIRAWGGELMAEAGAEIVKHYRDLAFMGFVEVVANLRTILRNERWCREDIAAFAPDRLIFIDYPGFNLRIARWARPAGYDITYYISPQVWAWHTSRVKQLRQNVDRLLVILPFEEEFFAKHDVSATFVGHPLLDVVRQKERGARPPVPGEEQGSKGLATTADGQTPEAPRKLIALLPGSRKQEITKGLPILLAAAARHPEHRYVVAGAPGQTPDFYAPFLSAPAVPPHLEIRHGDTYGLLGETHAALVTSGTATLETALFGVPQVVVYRGNWLSFQIGKRLVGKRIKYISLVNLVLDAPVVPELLQNDFNAENVAEHLAGIVEGSARERQLVELTRLRKVLGGGGAARRAAGLIVGEEE